MHWERLKVSAGHQLFISVPIEPVKLVQPGHLKSIHFFFLGRWLILFFVDCYWIFWSRFTFCNDLHVTEIWLKNVLTWKEKRLLIGTVCFNMLDTLDLRTERSTWSSTAQEVRVSFLVQRCFLQNRRVWGGVTLNIRVRGIHSEKGRIKHTQMKGKQCNFII